MQCNATVKKEFPWQLPLIWLLINGGTSILVKVFCGFAVEFGGGLHEPSFP